MRNLFFVLKTFLFTFLVVALLQVRIGGDTIEEHTLMWFEGTPVHRSMNEVVSGGAMLIEDSLGALAYHLEKKISNEVSDRASQVEERIESEMERGHNYLKDQREKWEKESGVERWRSDDAEDS